MALGGNGMLLMPTSAMPGSNDRRAHQPVRQAADVRPHTADSPPPSTCTCVVAINPLSEVTVKLTAEDVAWKS